MTHTRLWLAATIIAGFILIGFVISVPHTRDSGAPIASTKSAETTPEVTLRDTYRKGVHTLSGSILAPNACTTLTANATLENASGTEGILIDILMPADTGVCLQEAVTRQFSTTLTAPASLPVRVTVNGIPATVTAP